MEIHYIIKLIRTKLLCCRILLLPFLVLAMLAMNFNAYSQAIDFKQGSNKNNPAPQGSIVWINSILNANNSLYYEGMATLQRVIVTGIPSNPNDIHTLRIKLQSDKGGQHAYDFITSWDLAFQNATKISTTIFPSDYTDPDLNKCGPEIPNSLIAVCDNLHSAYTKLLPVSGELDYPLAGDINSVSAVVNSYDTYYSGRSIRVYGSSPFSANAANHKVTFVKYEAGYIFYDITWQSASTDVIIEFAAHIAAGIDPEPVILGYGPGRGASNINGGPYHVIIVDFQGGNEGNLGNLDNQLQGSSIFVKPPSCSPPTGLNLCPNQAGNIQHCS